MNELMENFEAFGKNYLNRLTELLGEMDLTQIDLLMNLCNQARLKGNTIFFAKRWKRPLRPTMPAFPRCQRQARSRSALLRAFDLRQQRGSDGGNDFGYDNIFVEQLTTLIGQSLVVISASATSNVVKAVKWVNSQGGTTFGLVGFDGGKLHQICTTPL